MKKKLKFNYISYSQIIEIQKGNNKDFTFIEAFQRYKDNPHNKYEDERWALFKQNDNDLLFIITFITKYNNQTKSDYRCLQSIRVLNKFNHLFYKLNKKTRDIINEFYLLIYIIPIGTFIFSLDYYDKYIASKINFFPNNTILRISINLFPIVLFIILWNVISKLIRKTEKEIIIDKMI